MRCRRGRRELKLGRLILKIGGAIMLNVTVGLTARPVPTPESARRSMSVSILVDSLEK